MKEYLDIDDRNRDYKFIYSETFRAELGVRTIGLIYHDHPSDKKSYDNVFRLKENIEYRLFSATHQYKVFLKELQSAEDYLQDLYTKTPRYIHPGTFPFGNPYFEKVEVELSSIFDSIIFHLSSVFDYLSHAICYMYFVNKEKTLYWPQLSKKVRGDFRNKYAMSSTLDLIDRRFVGHLYDYRSRLFHHKRDKHKFAGTVKFNDFSFRLTMSCSDVSLKHFALINEENKDNKLITLTFLSSWLLKKTFQEIENLLDAVKIDIEKDSKFYQNLAKPKDNRGLMFVTMNPETKQVEPMSMGFWKEYKEKKQKNSDIS